MKKISSLAQLLLFAVMGVVPGMAQQATDSSAVLPATHQSVNNITRAVSIRSWKISLAPLVGSQVFDVASSYGMRELNPLLADANGGFGPKAASIKIVATAAIVGVEYLVVRKFPRSARTISKLNWTTGIVTTGFAVHNYAIK